MPSPAAASAAMSVALPGLDPGPAALIRYRMMALTRRRGRHVSGKIIVIAPPRMRSSGSPGSWPPSSVYVRHLA